MNNRLSILICSLEDRKESLDKLLVVLMEQTTDEVEILVETDNGELTTGAKRNILLERAIGDYVVFVDDDDMVSDDYIPNILKAIESNPDCCRVEGTVSRGNNKHKFINCLDTNNWGYLFHSLVRTTNHINPVKRELALQVKFPDQDYREDQSYAMRLKPLLKTEANVEGIVYFYHPKHSPNKS